MHNVAARASGRRQREKENSYDCGQIERGARGKIANRRVAQTGSAPLAPPHSLTHDWSEQLEIRSCSFPGEARSLVCFALAPSVGPLCRAEIIRLSPLTLRSTEIHPNQLSGKLLYCGEHPTDTFPFKATLARTCFITLPFNSGK